MSTIDPRPWAAATCRGVLPNEVFVFSSAPEISPKNDQSGTIRIMFDVIDVQLSLDLILS